MSTDACDECRCHVCIALYGFNAERCHDCPSSSCKAGNARVDGCTNWLAAGLRTRSISRTTGTAPVPLDKLRRVAAALQSRADSAAISENGDAMPERVLAWAKRLATEGPGQRIDITTVIDIAVAEAIDDNLPPCPSCRTRVVRDYWQPGSHGFCKVCWLERIKAGHDDVILELQALKDVEQSKTELKRLRRAMGDEVPVELRAAKRRKCSECGRLFATRTAELVCPKCSDKTPRHSDR